MEPKLFEIKDLIYKDGPIVGIIFNNVEYYHKFKYQHPLILEILAGIYHNYIIDIELGCLIIKRKVYGGEFVEKFYFQRMPSLNDMSNNSIHFNYNSQPLTLDSDRCLDLNQTNMILNTLSITYTCDGDYYTYKFSLMNGSKKYLHSVKIERCSHAYNSEDMILKIMQDIKTNDYKEAILSKPRMIESYAFDKISKMDLYLPYMDHLTQTYIHLVFINHHISNTCLIL